MSTFDVRNGTEDISKIVFDAEPKGLIVATHLEKWSEDRHVAIHDSTTYVLVRLGSIDNLIKALQKAKELGWN